MIIRSEIPMDPTSGDFYPDLCGLPVGHIDPDPLFLDSLDEIIPDIYQGDVVSDSVNSAPNRLPIFPEPIIVIFTAFSSFRLNCRQKRWKLKLCGRLPVPV